MMDDGDLGDNIQHHAQVMDDNETTQGDGQQITLTTPQEGMHSDPSQWWFASGAFPMIAGTMGPVASAFSVCALVRPWRQHVPPGSDVRDGTFIPDPAWLLAINGMQLGVAIVSNVSLLLNMAQRVRFAVAQPVTIIGWYISAICLVCLLSTGAGPLLQGLDFSAEDMVWSQAFWYGVWAALLYFIVASLMAITVYGAHACHYAKDFNLTASQRTLMLQTMLILMYLLVGAVVFSYLEGWAYLDAVYWACVTIFTVGFGDYAAQTTTARALLLPYSLVGIISLGLVIGSIRSLVLERGRRRIEERVIDRARRKHLRKMARAGKDRMLAPIQMEPSNDEVDVDDAGDASAEAEASSREFGRRRAEFELMRRIQSEAARRRRWMALGTSAVTWVVLWLIGAKVFQEAERPYQGWSFWDGVYFTFVTLTTIGYGDRTPHSNCGKSFFVFWALLALPTTTVLISNAGDTVVKFVRDATIQGGKVTILPGDASVIKELKHVMNKLSFGRIRLDDMDDDPRRSPSDSSSAEGCPGKRRKSGDNVSDIDVEGGRRGARQENARCSNKNTNNKNNGDNQGAVLQDASYFHPRARGPCLDLPRDPKAPLPTGPELHYVLIYEIANVTAHLTSRRKRQYTFDEWAWYLKLLGEDEASADTHRRAHPHKHDYPRPHSRHRYNHSRNSNDNRTDSSNNNSPNNRNDHSHDPTNDNSSTTNGNDNDGCTPCQSPASPKSCLTRNTLAWPSILSQTDGQGGNADTAGGVFGEGEPGELKWSWVGRKSPLMSHMDESDWILQRLTARLKEELHEVRKLEVDAR